MVSDLLDSELYVKSFQGTLQYPLFSLDI